MNMMAALISKGSTPLLTGTSVVRTYRDEDVLHLIEKEIPHGSGALVVVLDNAGIHRSRVIRAARARLQRKGIILYYLPACAPELNHIEGVFGATKITICRRGLIWRWTNSPSQSIGCSHTPRSASSRNLQQNYGRPLSGEYYRGYSLVQYVGSDGAR